MYRSSVPHLPVEISREEFVELVFDLGRIHSHGYDTIVASVELGDYFVSFPGPREPFIELTNEEKARIRTEKIRAKREIHLLGGKSDFGLEARITAKIIAARTVKTFLDEPVPQIYSIELAHVVSVIVAKYNETAGYRKTTIAMADTENRFIVKMEWELLLLIGYKPKVSNFMTLIGLITNKDQYSREFRHLSSVFWDLSKEICLNRELLNKDPWTLVMGIFLLGRMGKLRALRTNRERKFRQFIVQLAKEFELDLSELLQAYIQARS